MTKELDIFEVLRSNIRKQLNDVSDHMSGGACKAYAEYTRCCGIVQGLAQAEREIFDLKARYEQAD